MSEVTVSVSSAISVDLKVLRWLKDQGADVEQYLGIRFFVTEYIRRQCLFWTWMSPRRLLIAQLYFNNKDKHAEPSKNWVIDAYGESYLNEVTDWAEMLSAEFKVKMHVRLETEHPRDLEEELRRYDW